MRLPLILIIAVLLALAHTAAIAASPTSADPTLTRLQDDDEQPMKPRPDKRRKRPGQKPTKKKPVKKKPVKRPPKK